MLIDLSQRLIADLFGVVVSQMGDAQLTLLFLLLFAME